MGKLTKPKFKAENFELVMNYDLASSSSYVVMDFINGWKQGFYFRESTNEGFMALVNATNKMIECICSAMQLKEPCKARKMNTKTKTDLLC
jgi:hypothetical protein